VLNRWYIHNIKYTFDIYLIRSHSDQRDFLCTMCGKQYKRKDKLKIHMNKVHYSIKKPSKTQLKLEARAEKKAQQIQLVIYIMIIIHFYT